MESTDSTHPDIIEHGTYRAYSKHKCRCPECREACRLRMADYRRRKFVTGPRTNVNPYRAAHTRVRITKGKASIHPCALCSTRADDWALINDSPRVIEKRIDGVRRRWSGHVDDYRPLCRSCHRAYDAQWNARPPRAAKPLNPRPPRAEKPPKRDPKWCANGHDRTLKGATRQRHDGRMECVECARERVRRYRKKNRHPEIAATV